MLGSGNLKQSYFSKQKSNLNETLHKGYVLDENQTEKKIEVKKYFLCILQTRKVENCAIFDEISKNLAIT